MVAGRRQEDGADVAPVAEKAGDAGAQSFLELVDQLADAERRWLARLLVEADAQRLADHVNRNAAEQQVQRPVRRQVQRAEFRRPGAVAAQLAGLLGLDAFGAPRPLALRVRPALAVAVQRVPAITIVNAVKKNNYWHKNKTRKETLGFLGSGGRSISIDLIL